MDKITHDLEGVISIADDICVYGATELEHDINLHKFMQKVCICGLVLNKNKCFIKVPEITFFGSVYSQHGVKPDPARTKEITSLTAPESKKKLMSFLGMVQYLSPYIQHLSDLTAPLRNLLKKETDFVWTATHQNAFNKIKDTVSNATTLNFFYPQFQTILEVDSSKEGLGAALIQIDPEEPNKERIVAFASKALSEVETQYANIERELLAVVFGVEKFHTYIYGKSIKVESDHKPLETMMLKNLSQTPPRLQRMLLRLQPYDIKITYKPGKDLQLADFLSRYRPNCEGKHIEMEQTIHSIKWSSDKLLQLQKDTKEDPILSKLIQVVVDGWPEKCSDLP
jgi:hypothetical protein